MGRAVSERTDLLQGTLDFLILRTLRAGPLHGWAISKRIRDLSADVLQINQGSLYPALYRLEDRGWLRSAWHDPEEGGRRIKLYELTAAGRKQATEEQRQWKTFVGAVARLMEGT